MHDDNQFDVFDLEAEQYANPEAGGLGYEEVNEDDGLSDFDTAMMPAEGIRLSKPPRPAARYNGGDIISIVFAIILLAPPALGFFHLFSRDTLSVFEMIAFGCFLLTHTVWWIRQRRGR